jgi:hypothetical protein
MYFAHFCPWGPLPNTSAQLALKIGSKGPKKIKELIFFISFQLFLKHKQWFVFAETETYIDIALLYR